MYISVVFLFVLLEEVSESQLMDQSIELISSLAHLAQPVGTCSNILYKYFSKTR